MKKKMGVRLPLREAGLGLAEVEHRLGDHRARAALLPVLARGTVDLDLDVEVVGFFFFQAEDGIRDIGVTGVQTCALPISTTAVNPLWTPVEPPPPWRWS